MAINLEDHELEYRLRSELQGVADRVAVPPLPQFGAVPESAGEDLANDDRSRSGWWNPTYLAVAAVAALIVGLVATLAVVRDDDGDGRPAPSGPSDPTDSAAPTSIPTDRPTIPYVEGTRLFVGGEAVPGRWYAVLGGENAWVAQRADGKWWWGNSAPVEELARLSANAMPQISPSGRYIAYPSTEKGQDVITAFDTDQSGDGFGFTPVPAGDPGQGTEPRVNAVTDEGQVLAQAANESILWTPYVGDGPAIDVTDRLAGRSVLGATPQGVVISGLDPADMTRDAVYLMRVEEDGRLRKIRDLPANDGLSLSADGSRMVWNEFGTTGGEVLGLEELEKGTADGQNGTVKAPDGWVLNTPDGWEDNEFFIAVASRGVVEVNVENRTVRCSFSLGRCAFIKNQE